MSNEQQIERNVYLDSNASTPIAPEVIAAMRPFMAEEAYGNPSSAHWAGTTARHAVESARKKVAGLLGANSDEIIFTSGGTEANNTAIKGAYFASGRRDAQIITSAIEHPATLASCAFLSRLGAHITIVGVDRYGRIDPHEVEQAISDRTILITLMHANNEVGTIQPIAEIAAVARERRVTFHTDAAQSVGKIPTRISELGVDLLSIAGHKLHAPKGVGALYVRRGIELEPLLHGGGQESGRRAGTESALLASALGAACELAASSIDRAPLIRALRDRLWIGLSSLLGSGVVLNGHPEERLPNTLNVSFVGRYGADVLAAFRSVAASTGSACHEGSVRLSPVLKAMGVPPEVGMGAVRFSLCRSTTAEEIEAVLSLAARVL
jgi:cysteine desulfurase